MATILETPIDAPDLPPTRRRLWPRILVALVAVTAISAGIGAFVYAQTYQPLGDANVGVEGTSTPHTLKILTDGYTDTHFALVGPQGTTGRTTYTFANNGRFAVRILGGDAEFAPFIANLQWASPARPADARNFPMTLEPGDMIFLKVTVAQPNCQGPGTYELPGIPIRYSALGVHHVWTLPLGTATTNLSIIFCSPKAAIARSTTQAS
jgi:hypothetical protein